MSWVSVLSLTGLVAWWSRFAPSVNMAAIWQLQPNLLALTCLPGSPKHHIKACRSQLGTCKNRQLFSVLNACMHRLEATACGVTRQLLCSPCYFGMSAKRGSKNKAAKHKTGPSTVTSSKNKLIERCGIPGSSTPRPPAASQDLQQRADEAM